MEGDGAEGAVKFPAVIELNVGGQHVSTLLSTLVREPDSMLAAMFSGRHPIAVDKDGRYFIDADGSVFSQVLEYLRFGILPATADLVRLHSYALYFGIQSLVDELEAHFPVKAAKMAATLRAEIPDYDKTLSRLLHEMTCSWMWGDQKTLHVKYSPGKTPVRTCCAHRCFVAPLSVLAVCGPGSDSTGQQTVALLVNDLERLGYRLEVKKVGKCGFYPCTKIKGQEHSCQIVKFYLNLVWPNSAQQS